MGWKTERGQDESARCSPKCSTGQEKDLKTLRIVAQREERDMEKVCGGRRTETNERRSRRDRCGWRLRRRTRGSMRKGEGKRDKLGKGKERKKSGNV